MRKDTGFRGFEDWFNKGKMSAKMVGVTFVTVLVFYVLSSLILGYIFLPEGSACFLAGYVFTDAFSCLTGPPPIGDAEAASGIILAMKRYFVYALPVWVMYPLLMNFYRRRSVALTSEKHLRGGKIISEGELKKQLSGVKVDLPVGPVKMPVGAEVKHAFVIGRPGVGKTLLFRSVIDRLRERGDKAVVYDMKGDYLCKFYDPAVDILFNPLDRRCVRWSLFNEIQTRMDVEAITASLIPRGDEREEFWRAGARDVARGILFALRGRGLLSNGDIHNAITSGKADLVDLMRAYPGGHPGVVALSDNEKRAGDMLTMLTQHLKFFEYLLGLDGTFSVRRWVGNGRPGFLFLTNYSLIKDTLRPILSLLVDLIGINLLGLPDSDTRRVFFMLDEFGTLQRLSSLEDILKLSRSKGGSVWLGIQDTGQLEQVYRKEGRQTLANACSNSVIFSVSDPDTAEYLSRRIGEREYLEADEGQSMGPALMRDGVNITTKKKTDRLVLPSEIMGLKEREAYIGLADYDLARVRLDKRAFKDEAESLILRDDVQL